MLERRVVCGRQVPREIGEKPDGERDRRAGELRHCRKAGDPFRKRRRNAEDQERRRPLREDHVLEQVRREQVVAQRFQRRHSGDEQENTARRERRDSPALDTGAADRDGVPERKREDTECRLGVDRPRIGIRPGDRALR